MSITKYAPRPYVEVRTLALNAETRRWYIDSEEPFEGHFRRLGGRERFEYGGTASTMAGELIADIPGEASRITEKSRFILDGVIEEWLVTNVVPYPSKGVVRIEAERTY